MMKRIDTINVIPLIDIMLVMLAIVLTTATFISVGKINVDLPDVSAGAETTSEFTVTIVVNAEGSMFFNDRQISETELERTLSGLDTETVIALKVDRRADFGDFTNVVDALNKFELQNIAILVEPSGS